MVRSRMTRVALALLVAVAGALSWRILTIGLADQWSRSQPSRALSWRPHEPRALEEAAESAIARNDYDTARSMAIRGIRAYPLDGINYRVLAMADAAQDRKSRIPDLLAIAERRAPFDLPTHGLLVTRALKSRDVSLALQEFSLILRIQPKLQPLLLPRMVTLAIVPQARPELISALSESPPWRTAFLRVLATQVSDGNAVAAIFNGLHLSEAETAFLIDRQIRDSDWNSAYVTWVASLTAAQQKVLGNVFDGEFRFPPSDVGFGWRLANDVQVQARIGQLSDGSANGLSVDFDQARVRFDGLKQQLALGEGHYIFHGRMRSVDLVTSRGLQWVITCAERRHQILAASPLLNGTQPWRTFDVPFDVPDDQCGGQWLHFQMAARDRIDGHLETTGLSIERQDEALDAPPKQPAGESPPVAVKHQ